MADGEFKIENRFSSSRGVFPYIVGILGVALVVVIFMLVTGIGRDRLPYTDYFFAVRAPKTQKEPTKTQRGSGPSLLLAGQLVCP